MLSILSLWLLSFPWLHNPMSSPAEIVKHRERHIAAVSSIGGTYRLSREQLKVLQRGYL